MTPVEGRPPWALPLLAGVFVLLAIVHAQHGPALGADDHGQYLLHARALVEGRSYTDIGFLHSRYSTMVAPVAEPPGLPLMLAGAFVLGGASGVAAKGVLLVAFGLTAWAVFSYWRRTEGPWMASAIAIWTLIALSRQDVLGTVLADLPFMACWWWACDLASRDRPTRRAAVALVVAGSLAFSFRMAALPLIPAAMTMAVCARRGSRGMWVVAAATWILVAAAVMIGLSAGSALGSESVRGTDVLLRDLTLNVEAMVDGVRQGIPLAAPWSRGTLAIHVLVVAICATGAVRAIREPRHRWTWVLAAWYVLMLLTLPTRAGRYVWPLVPLLAFSFARGLQWLVGLSGTARAARVPSFVIAGFLLVALWQSLRAPAPRTFGEVVAVQDVIRFLSAEQVQTPEIRVVFFSPRVLTWETGIPSAPMFAAPVDTALAFLREHAVTHVVAGDAGSNSFGRAGIEALVAASPAALVPAFANSEFRVFRFVPKASQ